MTSLIYGSFLSKYSNWMFISICWPASEIFMPSLNKSRKKGLPSSKSVCMSVIFYFFIYLAYHHLLASFIPNWSFLFSLPFCFFQFLNFTNQKATFNCFAYMSSFKLFVLLLYLALIKKFHREKSLGIPYQERDDWESEPKYFFDFSTRTWIFSWKKSC